MDDWSQIAAVITDEFRSVARGEGAVMLLFARGVSSWSGDWGATPGRVAAPGYSLTAAGWHMDCDLHRAATFVLAKLCSVVNKVRREDKRASQTSALNANERSLCLTQILSMNLAFLSAAPGCLCPLHGTDVCSQE